MKLLNVKSISVSLLIIVAVSVLSWKPAATNALLNTKWNGLLLIPGPEQGTLSFKKDTLLVYAGNQVVETSFYQVKSDTLSIRKISGGSPCKDEVGNYRYTIKFDKLVVTALQDGCTARTTCFDIAGYQLAK